MPEFEVIAERGRFVLGGEEDSYGIWDLDVGDEPVARFEMSDEGFERAWQRFEVLQRVEADIVGKILATVIIGGVVVWIAGGVLTMLTFVFFELNENRAFSVLGPIMDVVGFRLAVGGSLLLITVVLLRRRAQGRAAPGPAVPVFSIPGDGFDRFLVGALLVSLAVWITAAVVAATTVRPEIIVPFRGPQAPSTLEVIAQVVQSISFDVWTAAAVLIGLRTLQRLRMGVRQA